MLLFFKHSQVGGELKIEVKELNGYVTINNKIYLWITVSVKNIEGYNNVYHLNEVFQFPRIEFGKNEITFTFPQENILSIMDIQNKE